MIRKHSGRIATALGGGLMAAMFLSAAVSLTCVSADVATGEPPSIKAVRLSVDSTRQHTVSRFIYGLNSRTGTSWGGHDTSRTTLDRLGGNRYTAYNWKTNDSNCGSDCGKDFGNDDWLVWGLPNPGEPAAAVTSRTDASRALGRAGSIITVPVAGWVAGDHAGATAPLPVAESVDKPAKPNARFRKAAPRRPLEPRPGDDTVYMDDFVKLIAKRYPNAMSDPVRPVWFTLDNEPDLWGSTHAEIRGRTASGDEVLTGFDELVGKTVEYAAAIKDAAPGAQVLAPGLSGWYGFFGLGNKKPPTGYSWFVDFFLDKMQRASDGQGRRLVDIFDVHWYPEARNTCRAGEGGPCWSERITNDWQPQTESVIEARVQAPRSLWDPTYTEQSWVTDAIPGCWSPKKSSCPIKLLPRLRESIARYSPGTKIAVTEYYYGRGGDISGAVAQADVLGIFGREGVYAATLWPQASVYAWNTPAGACDGDVTCSKLAYGCLFTAFRAFLDYDGKGGRFGDIGVDAFASDPARASVYASLDPSNPSRLVIVAINKQARPLEVLLELKGPASAKVADVFQVTGEVGRCKGPSPAGQIPLKREGTPMVLPPLSITVLLVQ